jgi:hypothetical protein
MSSPVVYLVLITLGLAVLSFGLVWAFRRSIGNRAYWLAPAPFFVTLIVMFAISRADEPGDYSPRFVPATSLAGLIKSLPDYAQFGFSGLAIYKEKLYVSTNVGLIVIDGGRVTGLYRVQKTYSVVSGPWSDSLNQLLWIMDDQTNQLLNFDGTVWHRISVPAPRHGYLSRGDVLEGPKPMANANGFWLEYGGRVWQWNASKQGWTPELQPSPPAGSSDFPQAIGVLPIVTNLLFIERHELLPFLIKDGQDFSSDTVVDGNWHEVPNNSGAKFLVEESIVADDAGYVCTKNGSILKVTIQAITKLDAPGKCETLAVTTSGTPLASLRGKGIFEYRGNWMSRAPHPYPSGAGEYWTFLSENGSTIALAIDGKPVSDKDHLSGTDMRFTKNAPTELWLYQGSEFHLIHIP